jgi:hypothetical protein
MPASLDDILTAAKNLVSAVNDQTANNTILAGATDFWKLTTATVVKASPGRIMRVSLIATGSATGTVYDAKSITDTTRPIYTIANSATGVTLVDIPCQYGIVVTPGTGQTVSGSYS